MAVEGFRIPKIFLIFLFWAIFFNVLLIEIMGRFVLKIPEPLDILGMLIFYSLFSFIGAIILFYKNYPAKKMGFLSLILGLACEFTFMKPEWVQKFYALEITGEAILPLIASSILVWFPIWLFPSYLVYKYITKNKEKYSDKFAKRLLILILFVYILLGLLVQLKPS